MSCAAHEARELRVHPIRRKYAGLNDHYVFAHDAVKNSKVPSSSTRQLLSNLCHRLVEMSGKSHETRFLFQKCSVLMGAVF